MNHVPYVVPAGVIAVFLGGLALVVSTGGHAAERRADPSATQPGHRSPSTTRHAPAATKPAAAAGVTPLFDGKTLKNWKATEFGGEGEVSVEEGQIVVRSGATLSGVTWHGAELPRVNYEIELDAMKLDGSDFFVGLTFPYQKECASLILGGWGGGIVGISSINGDDAANNESMTSRDFPKNKWVHVRLRVTEDRITAWLDKEDEPVVNVETADKIIGTRSDIDLARPLGLSNFQTSSAFKNITLKKL
jgi:hypothetical protein